MQDTLIVYSCTMKCLETKMPVQLSHSALKRSFSIGRDVFIMGVQFWVRAPVNMTEIFLCNHRYVT